MQEINGLADMIMQKRFVTKSGSADCRTCGDGVETMGHVLSACRLLSWGAYKMRHDRVLQLLAKATLEAPIPKELRTAGKSAVPGTYCTRSAEVRVDTPIMTSKVMREMWPDLYIRMQRSKQIFVCDVAVAWDKNVRVSVPKLRLLSLKISPTPVPLPG